MRNSKPCVKYGPIDETFSIEKARACGYITTKELAEAVGIDRLIITGKANKIPGSVKLNNLRWVFPKTAVQWASKRLKFNLRI